MISTQFLFAFTFLFGALRLLTMTHIFRFTAIEPPFRGLIGLTNTSQTFVGGLIVLIDVASFYLSLFYQIWFWYDIII